VVHAHSLEATHWNGESKYWEHIDQPTVNNMVDQGIMTLTGKMSATESWRAILPNYQPGQKIAIKVNFNNTWQCQDVDARIDALPHPVNAVVSGLELIGVARSDVCVYDAIRAIPGYFAASCLDGISLYDGSSSGVCRNPAGFSYTGASRVEFNPPIGVTPPEVYVTNVLMNASYLINMPIMKAGHPIAGVTLGAKNHFGTINSPSSVHTLVNVGGGTARDDYNPLVDFFRSPLIGGKTVLTVGDGLFAARVFNQAPQTWTTFGGKLPNSLLLSRDIVAVDCVMRDLLAAEVGGALTAKANNYLRLAGEAGLGVFEQGNPWQMPYGSGYSQIQYLRVAV
jgi:hypothetical protein